jgi:hypothetical protein
MAARYNSNHFQLLSYRIWEEYRALSANAAAIPPSSMCTSASSVPLGTVPLTAEMGEIRAAELPTAIAGVITAAADSDAQASALQEAIV